jgi:aspartate kinase
MIVMKFGGTSTQDAAAMTNVAKIVGDRLASRPVVVISAIAGATNALEKIGTLASHGKPNEAAQVIRELLGRHEAIVDTLIRNEGRRTELHAKLTDAGRELGELVHGVSILRELTPRTLDAFCAFGELLSSRLIAAVMQEQGIDARWLDTADFMVTDDQHARALPNMDIVETRLRAITAPLLSGGKVPVTQGFIGVTESGRRTTMGRESSDYSAAVIGAALGADDIQIWTDVDGVLTADPRVVASPLKVTELTFDEAYQLSYFGAKVLHPNTMLPAIEKNIPIHIFNSRHPGTSGTRVVAGRPDHDAVIKSIAYKHNAVLLTARPAKRYNQFVFWEHLFNILTKFDAAPGMVVTSEFSIGVVLDARQNIASIVHELQVLGAIDLLEKKAILSVVGSNIKKSPGVMARLMTAVGAIAVHAVSFGASRSNVSILIDDEGVEDAVRRVHEEFFGSAVHTGMFESAPLTAGSLVR